jgi:multidrug transporter EmrE-like cation transporter
VRAARVRLPRDQLAWFTGAVAAGGVVGPVLLMTGLARIPASDASLLLTSEGMFTALLAWFAFKENFDRRVALGMCLIVAGAAVLGWPGQARFAGLWPTLAVLGACFAWGIDNNLTRKVALADATWIASVKGLVAGCVNFGLALSMGAAPISRRRRSSARCSRSRSASASRRSSPRRARSRRSASGSPSPSATSTSTNTRSCGTSMSTSTTNITGTSTRPARPSKAGIRTGTGTRR